MTSALALPFPLREGYRAQIVVPDDMSTTEAARLCAFVASLAVPETALVQDGFSEDARRLRRWFVFKEPQA